MDVEGARQGGGSATKRNRLVSNVLRRGIECDGYTKCLKWRPVGQLKPGRKAENSMNTLESDRLDSAVEVGGSVLVQDQITHPFQPRAPSRSRYSPNNVQPVPPILHFNHGTTPLLRSTSSSPHASVERLFSDFDVGIFDLGHLDQNVLPNIEDVDLLSANATDETFHNYWSLYESLDWPIGNPEAVVESMETVHEENIADVETSIQHLSPQPPSVSHETIRDLFHVRTCESLSIKDNQAKNPWKTLVWALADNCPALYHALAAMTYFYLCNTQPELRHQGMRHYQYSVQALAANQDSGDILIESALAARLALGFAESWDPQKSSTGMDQIKIAKKLVQQALLKHQTSRLSAGDLSRLCFLANTWMYMDVIARFTCIDDGGSNDFEFMNACSLLSPVPSEQQIDPLMGYATTLFPMIGRLADLVARVRRRTEKRNSPAIISKAIDLWRAIECWIPPIDAERSEDSEDPKSNISDSIQTAEAYRWASLLTLRQAVPELPWSHSIWELAQKALVFLATVPLSSRATIVQIFPLMVAGCEAVEEEDRVWVSERWELMSKRMITGIVDRCNKVTAEVWRRRDYYLENHQSRSPSSDFPESAAFRKDIDPLTRAGSIRYTVKGDLHWLGVMKEWGWQVMLG